MRILTPIINNLNLLDTILYYLQTIHNLCTIYYLNI
nr:MAG TPA: hypothetical protein [Caudoviricetes sp.]